MNRGLPIEMRQRYFQESSNNKGQVKSSLTAMIKFKQLNLLNDFSALGQFDIVFCRNVLIYFDGNQKNQILKKIAACLPINSSLFLGAAESISGSEQYFSMKNINQGLYYKRL